MVKKVEKKSKQSLTIYSDDGILKNVARKSASVAQLVEHHVANVIVAGSTPVTRSKLSTKCGRLAQSVEQGTENPRVPSSILGPATIFLPFFLIAAAVKTIKRLENGCFRRFLFFPHFPHKTVSGFWGDCLAFLGFACGTQARRFASSGTGHHFFAFFQRQKNMKPEKASLHGTQCRFIYFDA